MEGNWGKYIISFGLLIVVIGVVVYFFGNKLTWIGHLPGDIRVEKGNTRFYFPVVTMVLLSLLLSLVLYVVRRWM
jgi:hypothetical protein